MCPLVPGQRQGLLWGLPAFAGPTCFSDSARQPGTATSTAAGPSTPPTMLSICPHPREHV